MNIVYDHNYVRVIDQVLSAVLVCVPGLKLNTLSTHVETLSGCH